MQRFRSGATVHGEVSDPCRNDPEYAQAMLCWVSSMAFRLGCAAQIPWLQDGLIQLMVMEEPVGSSHLVQAITPPVWPCFYLTVQ